MTTQPPGPWAPLALPPSNGMLSVGEKAHELDNLNRSVLDASPTNPAPGASTVMLFALAQAGESFVSWGTLPFARDAQLRNFWPTEPFLASALGIIGARNGAMEWKITGDERTADAAALLLQNANFGAGWEDFIIRITLDLLTQDKGAFAELLRAGDSPEAPVIGLNSLDAARCHLTGVPEEPVWYEDAMNRMHRMQWYQVVQLLEMPSPYTFPRLGHFYRLQYCLDGDANVRMADGTTKRMSAVVRDRDEGPVLALDATGQMSPARITNWYANPRDGREWINLRGRYASIGRGSKRRNSWMTADHPVLTPDGWSDAGALVTGDPIVTEYPAPNDAQAAFIVGTMLGDASMPAANVRPRITIGHKAAHREWVEIKARVLAPFGATVRASGPVVFCDTKVQPAFVALRDAFYSDGRKRVPRTLVERYFSPALLAAWYLDDGHLTDRSRSAGLRPWRAPARPRADIGCSALSWEDAEWLAALLTVHGYDANVLRQGGRSAGPRLFFSTRGTAALLRDIGRFVPECLRYKAGAEAPAFDVAAWDLGPAERFIDEALIERDPTRGGETVYCIDVEDTHNFVTAGIVVHNCAVTRLLRAAQIIKSIGTYNEEKISGRFQRAVHLLQGVTAEEFRDALNRGEFAADQMGLSRYIQPAVVGSIDPKATVDVKTVNLATLPEGWDEEKSLKWYITAIAMALLTDYGEFAPLPGGNLGTSAQSEVMHLKSRGKGQGLFQQLIARLVNLHGVLPRNVQFEWDEQDIEAEQTEALVKKTRGEGRALRVVSGEITPRVARQLALEAGDLTEEQVKELEAEDEAAAVAAEAAPAPPARGLGNNTVEGEDRSEGGPGAGDDSTTEGEDRTGGRGMTTVTPEWSAKARGAVPFGTLITSRLHRAYAMVADDASGLGYFPDLDDRLAVASSIGPALKVFEDALREHGVWDIPVRAADADRLVEIALKAVDPESEGLDDTAARLAFEGEFADDIFKGLQAVRRDLRARLRAQEGGERSYHPAAAPGVEADVEHTVVGAARRRRRRREEDDDDDDDESEHRAVKVQEIEHGPGGRIARIVTRFEEVPE